MAMCCPFCDTHYKGTKASRNLAQHLTQMHHVEDIGEIKDLIKTAKLSSLADNAKITELESLCLKPCHDEPGRVQCALCDTHMSKRAVLRHFNEGRCKNCAFSPDEREAVRSWLTVRDALRIQNCDVDPQSFETQFGKLCAETAEQVIYIQRFCNCHDTLALRSCFTHVARASGCTPV